MSDQSISHDHPSHLSTQELLRLRSQSVIIQFLLSSHLLMPVLGFTTLGGVVSNLTNISYYTDTCSGSAQAPVARLGGK